MAKKDVTDAVTGTVTAFLHSKFKQDSYRTVVALDEFEDAAPLVGARVVWTRADGLALRGRVVRLHGRKGSLCVLWDRGFPPQALGTPVKITK